MEFITQASRAAVSARNSVICARSKTAVRTSSPRCSSTHSANSVQKTSMIGWMMSTMTTGMMSTMTTTSVLAVAFMCSGLLCCQVSAAKERSEDMARDIDELSAEMVKRDLWFSLLERLKGDNSTLGPALKRTKRIAEPSTETGRTIFEVFNPPVLKEEKPANEKDVLSNKNRKNGLEKEQETSSNYKATVKQESNKKTKKEKETRTSDNVREIDKSKENENNIYLNQEKTEHTNVLIKRDESDNKSTPMSQDAQNVKGQVINQEKQATIDSKTVENKKHIRNKSRNQRGNDATESITTNEDKSKHKLKSLHKDDGSNKRKRRETYAMVATKNKATTKDLRGQDKTYKVIAKTKQGHDTQLEQEDQSVNNIKNMEILISPMIVEETSLDKTSLDKTKNKDILKKSKIQPDEIDSFDRKSGNHKLKPRSLSDHNKHKEHTDKISFPHNKIKRKHNEDISTENYTKKVYTSVDNKLSKGEKRGNLISNAKEKPAKTETEQFNVNRKGKVENREGVHSNHRRRLLQFEKISEDGNRVQTTGRKLFGISDITPLEDGMLPEPILYRTKRVSYPLEDDSNPTFGRHLLEYIEPVHTKSVSSSSGGATSKTAQSGEPAGGKSRAKSKSRSRSGGKSRSRSGERSRSTAAEVPPKPAAVQPEHFNYNKELTQRRLKDAKLKKRSSGETDFDIDDWEAELRIRRDLAAKAEELGIKLKKERKENPGLIPRSSMSILDRIRHDAQDILKKRQEQQKLAALGRSEVPYRTDGTVFVPGLSSQASPAATGTVVADTIQSESENGRIVTAVNDNDNGNDNGNDNDDDDNETEVRKPRRKNRRKSHKTPKAIRDILFGHKNRPSWTEQLRPSSPFNSAPVDDKDVEEEEKKEDKEIEATLMKKATGAVGEDAVIAEAPDDSIDDLEDKEDEEDEEDEEDDSLVFTPKPPSKKKRKKQRRLKFKNHRRNKRSHGSNKFFKALGIADPVVSEER